MSGVFLAVFYLFANLPKHAGRDVLGDVLMVSIPITFRAGFT
jgi:hypothetical protein